MKISRHNPYRQRRHPLARAGWIALGLFVLLLAAAWVKGGEQPVGPVEIPVPAERLGG